MRRALSAGVVLAALLVTVTACQDELLRLGMPEPVTRQGERILNLWQGSWVAAFGVGATVWGLIIWACIFHRKRSEELPPQVRYNLPIEVLYTVIPFIIVAVLFYFTARDQTEINRLSSNPDVVVDVTAFQWSWQFDYPQQDVTVVGRTGQPPTLVIPTGETVRFNLASTDVVHAFWVPAFLFKRDVVPGHPNAFEITATKEGTFAGRCAELCGIYHSQMLFNVRVVSPQEFDTFLASQPSGSTQ
ncbi:MAG: cytochrome c oxidase subunit II [Streptosporangiales bacterium]|nr:cytochrome c oxidase subunit II [Streptosporangiales bacterium]